MAFQLQLHKCGLHLSSLVSPTDKPFSLQLETCDCFLELSVWERRERSKILLCGRTQYHHQISKCLVLCQRDCGDKGWNLTPWQKSSITDWISISLFGHLILVLCKYLILYVTLHNVDTFELSNIYSKYAHRIVYMLCVFTVLKIRKAWLDRCSQSREQRIISMHRVTANCFLCLWGTRNALVKQKLMTFGDEEAEGRNGIWRH